MTVNDSFAYIPLFALSFVSFAVFILLFVIKKKSTARVSFILYTSTAIIFASSLISACMDISNPAQNGSNALFFFCTSVAVAGFILVPYCLMLTLFEPKKIDELVPPSINKKLMDLRGKLEKRANTEEVAENASLYEEKILAITRGFLSQSAGSYNSETGLSSFLDYINKTVCEQIKADGGAILMIDDFEDLITVKSFDGDFPPPYKLPNDMPHKPVRVATNFKFASFPLRGNIFGEVATAGKPELITDPNSDDRIYQNGPEEFLECGSYIIVPMKIQDVVIGVMAFARKHGNKLFSKEDLKISTTLSDFASASIQNAVSVTDIIEKSKLRKETEISTQIQNTLKPAKLPVISGMQLGTVWNPSDGVCGDFYDIVPSRKDRVSFILGDVAGKRMNSTIVMIMMRSMLRLVVNTTQSAGTILTWLNKGITGDSFSNDHFGSATLINYNPVKQEVEFATGGSIPVYYYDSAAKSIVKISKPTEPIGVEKSTEYKDFVQKVKSGDIILTYTDGLVECLNNQGQQYTKESLLKVIADNCNATGKDIAKKVKEDIKKFSGSAKQHDDETLLLVKIQ